MWRKCWIVTVILGALFVRGPRAAADDPDPGINNQPDITLPATVSTQPGQSVGFVPVVSDPDEHLLDMELEIDISDLDGIGGRSVPAGEFGTFSWGGGSGVTSDVELDTIADLNISLASFTYTPPAGFSGTARIIFEIDDQGNVGTGGVLSRTRFIDITVAATGDEAPATNDQPDIALPSSVTTRPGQPVTFVPVVTDVDVGPFDMELEIDISDLDGVGGRSVPAGEFGTFTWGGGSGVTSDVELEPLATLNGMLSAFTYAPPAGFAGTARIIFEIDDQGNTGTELPPNVLSRTSFVDILVAEPGDDDPAVNDPPDIALPIAATTGVDQPLALSPTVSDPDVGLGNMELEIDISDLDGVGGLDPAAGDYGTFTWGVGTAVTSDLLVAPLGGVDAALATFTYTPPAGFTGTARIIFEIDDQGNSGAELPPNVLSRTRFIDITVQPTADLVVAKTGPADAEPGDQVTFEITVTNSGPNDATALLLSDGIPAGTTFVSFQQTSGPAMTLVTPPVGGTGTVTAAAGSFADGATATFELTVDADDAFAGPIGNTATVTSTTFDPDLASNSDTVSTPIVTTTTSTSTTTTTTAPTTSVLPTTIAAGGAATTSSTAPGSGLPTTGGRPAPIATLALALVAAGAFGAFLARRRHAV